MQDSHIWPITATINEAHHLTIAECDVVELARDFGTPLYLLDEATFRACCRAYHAALRRHYPGSYSVHYASKALLNTAVAQMVVQEGLELDVVSGGELYVALQAGVQPQRVHFHGNAKTKAELQQALDAGVGVIIVDNLDELRLLVGLSAEKSHSQPIMLRVTPGIAPNTHSYIQTGQQSSKFGLSPRFLDTALEQVLSTPHLQLCGLHIHLGSQIFETEPFIQAITILLDQVVWIGQRFGVQIHMVSLGGGVGIPYLSEHAAVDINHFIASIAQAIVEGCRERLLALPHLTVEPGRSIAGRAGVAVYEVVGTKLLSSQNLSWPDWHHHEYISSSEEAGSLRDAQKVSPVTRYLHIDGGMGDNLRPALYGARYTALLANRMCDEPEETVHIAGRYCESGDILVRDVQLPRAIPGDLVAVAMSGAYTLSMASNYNLTPRPALVLVGNGRARLIQRRETYADLVARDTGLEEAL